MKLILTTEVEHLGTAGDAVEVKDGYGRNYLLPRGLAIVATRGAERQANDIRRAREAKEIRGVEHANEIKQAIEGLGAVKLTVKTAGEGKLFGSVTAADVVGAIKAAGGPKPGQADRDPAQGSHQADRFVRAGRAPARRCGNQGHCGCSRRRLIDPK